MAWQSSGAVVRVEIKCKYLIKTEVKQNTKFTYKIHNCYFNQLGNIKSRNPLKSTRITIDSID